MKDQAYPITTYSTSSFYDNERWGKYAKFFADINDSSEVTSNAGLDLLHRDGVRWNEGWTSENIQARIVGSDESKVYCDCVIDKEARKIQLRAFPKNLFEVIPDLSKGNPVYFVIQSKPGAIRIDVFNGHGKVDVRLFELYDELDELNDEDFNAPLM